jgi:radical SAM superfamily enzyme YgiQ (UPF0313 family)
MIAEGGIAFSVNNIIGFPDETREMVFETIEFNRNLRGYDTLTVSIFTPYHGTPLRELAVKKGYIDGRILTTHTTSSSLLNMPTLSSQEIDGLARPKIEVAERFDEKGEEMFAALSKMYQEYLGENQSTQRRHMDWEEVFGHMSKVQLR